MAQAKVVRLAHWRAVHPGNGVTAAVARLMLPFARQCAAYLITSNMELLRLRGCFYLHIDADDTAPRWPRMALAVLNAARWETSVSHDADTNENVYRVKRRKGQPHGALAA